MKNLALAVMAIANLAGATTAFASDNGWYLFGAVGKITGSAIKQLVDYELTYAGKNGFSSNLSTPTVYNLNVGYQINKNFAVEAGYIGSTSVTYSASGGNLAGPVTASAMISGGTAAAVGMLPLAEQFSLLGKVGVAYILTTAGITGLPGSSYLSGLRNDITCGVGVKYEYSDAVSIRLNLDSYNIGSSYFSPSRSNVWTVGVGHKF